MPHSCGYEFFKHGRTNTEVSILLEDRNRGRCTMGCFHTASETDLTATGVFNTWGFQDCGLPVFKVIFFSLNIIVIIPLQRKEIMS